ncbi:MAG: FAD-dependent oxidoreductase [Clostridiales bacterium]|jgi:ribulose 1,5-bisphosphate synthetase/thiazole synthase|nr:FAD-dependent oxidoreductase [Clostridiales bacterium]
MDWYEEKARKLKITNSVDVLVTGAGPSGVAAALAAARLGANTMLIERQGVLGGISTSGLMSHWTGSVNSGLYDEILQRSAARNEGEYKDKVTVIIDPEKLQTLYADMLCEAGVKLGLYTLASDAVTENNKVQGAIVESKSGREAILAKVVVDASGDGDLAARAGAAYVKGRESDGKMQPVTVMFKVAGVDTERAVFLNAFESLCHTEKGELQALAKQHISHPAGHVLLYRATLPGVVTCNMTNCVGIDGTNAEDLTRAELVCRKQIGEIIAFLREYAPGYEHCFLMNSAALIGVRETRRFKGLYTLTEQDILEARVFDDWVVRDASFNFDVHNITGAGLDETGVQKEFRQTAGYTIPYRCLVPEKTDGLLLCGRNISGTHMAHSNYRAMPICAAIGEASGTAAAIACRMGVEPREVKAEEIQKCLTAVR